MFCALVFYALLLMSEYYKLTFLEILQYAHKTGFSCQVTNINGVMCVGSETPKSLCAHYFD